MFFSFEDCFFGFEIGVVFGNEGHF